MNFAFKSSRALSQHLSKCMLWGRRAADCQNKRRGGNKTITTMRRVEASGCSAPEILPLISQLPDWLLREAFVAPLALCLDFCRLLCFMKFISHGWGFIKSATTHLLILLEHTLICNTIIRGSCLPKATEEIIQGNTDSCPCRNVLWSEFASSSFFVYHSRKRILSYCRNGCNCEVQLL